MAIVRKGKCNYLLVGTNLVAHLYMAATIFWILALFRDTPIKHECQPSYPSIYFFEFLI